MSQVNVGGTTLSFKDSSFTGDQWESVASWVLNGGAEECEKYAKEAKSYAKGGTATREGEDTDNAKYYKEQAAGLVADAQSSANVASASEINAEASKEAAATSATNAAASEAAALSYKNAAQAAAAAAERDAKTAADSKTAAAASAQTASAAAQTAKDDADSAAGSAAEAKEDADRAEAASAHQPRIGSDGYWELWDPAQSAYVKTSYQAQGAAGKDGDSYTVKGLYATLAELEAAHPTGSAGDAWFVGAADDNVVYQWDVDKAAWVNVGPLKGPAGTDGEDGVTPHIGDNGNWFIGSTDTGKPSRGAPGDDGAPGTPGTDGEDGAPGAAGKSAYASAQDGGYTGTEAQFNADLAQVSGKANTDDIPTALSELSDDATHRLVTDTEKTTWNAKQSKITASGILKGNGSGNVSAAAKGTDYAAPSITLSVALSASGWDAESKTQTVNAAGVTTASNCIITAAPDSYMAYAEAGVRCTAQGTGTLTFTCETVPTEDVAANVLILG